MLTIFVFICHLLIVVAIQLRSEGLKSYSNKQDVKLDIRTLREGQKAAGEIASFPHVRDLMVAIASNKKRVTITSKSVPKDVPTSFKNLDEMLSHSVSETNTVLDLHDDISYHSLNNDDNSLSIAEISDVHTLHCGAAKKNVGDFMFATGEIYSFNARLLKESSAFSTYMQEKVASKHHGDDERIVLLRRVLTVTPSEASGASCFTYETENVHPLEMLKGADITTSTQVPAHLSSSAAPPKKLVRDRALISNDWIDPSLRNCKTDTTAFPASSTSVKYDETDMYAVYDLVVNPLNPSAPIYLCGDFGGDTTSGSLGANYDFSKQTATVQSIDLGYGFTCQDCYAFVGSTVLTHVEYSFVTSTATTVFGAEVQVSGGAGFNIDVVMAAPNINSLSSPITTVIVAPSTAYSTILTIDATTFSTLDYKFGGMNAVVTAYVKATGSASFTTSATLDASIAAVYTLAANVLTIPVTHTDQIHGPAITNKLVFQDDIIVKVELPIVFNFQLSALAGILTCASHVDITPFIEYNYNSTTPSSTCTTAAEPADLDYGMNVGGGLGLISINLVTSTSTTPVYSYDISNIKADDVNLVTYSDCATTAGTSGGATSAATIGSTANIFMVAGVSALALLSFVVNV